MSLPANGRREEEITRAPDALDQRSEGPEDSFDFPWITSCHFLTDMEE